VKRIDANVGAPSVSPSMAALPTRGLTPEERDLLMRRFRSPAARVLRVLGAIFGFGAVVLALGYFAGFGFDPDVVSWEVLIVGVFSVGCTGAGSGMVRDFRAALQSGEVADVGGAVASLGGGPPGFTEFQVGGLLLQLPAQRAPSLSAGQLGRVCLALGLRPIPPKSARGTLTDRGLLLSVNGTPWAPPAMAFWKAVAVASPPPPNFLPPVPATSPPAPTVLLPPPEPVANPPPTPVSSTPAGAPPAPSEEVYCDRCGHQNPAGFRFCRKCGAQHA
jgi:zinc ribbon protein